MHGVCCSANPQVQGAASGIDVHPLAQHAAKALHRTFHKAAA